MPRCMVTTLSGGILAYPNQHRSLGGHLDRCGAQPQWPAGRLTKRPVGQAIHVSLTRPRSLIVCGTDVQTGPELRKHRRRKSLGEDVGILR